MSTTPGCASALPPQSYFPKIQNTYRRFCGWPAAAGFPVVARGAGTGLSGGAIAPEGGVVVAFARMHRILEVDAENMRAIVQPGVVNQQLSDNVAHLGLYFAPDPSSQKACTIGGNVAENSGGPHTLMYGVTVNHVTGLTVVMPSGEVVRFGGKAAESRRLRPDGILGGLRRDGRGCYRDYGAAAAAAGANRHAAGNLRNDRRRRKDGVGDYRRGDHAGSAGDAGWLDAARGGGGLPRGLSAGCGRGAAD